MDDKAKMHSTNELFSNSSNLRCRNFEQLKEGNISYAISQKDDFNRSAVILRNILFTEYIQRMRMQLPWPGWGMHRALCTLHTTGAEKNKKKWTQIEWMRKVVVSLSLQRMHGAFYALLCTIKAFSHNFGPKDRTCWLRLKTISGATALWPTMSNENLLIDRNWLKWSGTSKRWKTNNTQKKPSINGWKKLRKFYRKMIWKCMVFNHEQQQKHDKNPKHQNVVMTKNDEMLFYLFAWSENVSAIWWDYIWKFQMSFIWRMQENWNACQLPNGHFRLNWTLWNMRPLSNSIRANHTFQLHCTHIVITLIRSSFQSRDSNDGFISATNLEKKLSPQPKQIE